MVLIFYPKVQIFKTYFILNTPVILLFPTPKLPKKALSKKGVWKKGNHRCIIKCYWNNNSNYNCENFCPKNSSTTNGPGFGYEVNQLWIAGRWGFGALHWIPFEPHCEIPLLRLLNLQFFKQFPFRSYFDLGSIWGTCSGTSLMRVPATLPRSSGGCGRCVVTGVGLAEHNGLQCSHRLFGSAV